MSDKMNYIHATAGWIIIIGSIWDIADIIIHDGKAYFTYEHRVPAWIMMIGSIFGLGISGTAAFIGRKLIRWDT
jgi:cytochrome b involved in lipid metabolism